MSATMSPLLIVLVGLAFIGAPMLLGKIAGAFGADGKTQALVWVITTPVIIIVAISFFAS